MIRLDLFCNHNLWLQTQTPSAASKSFIVKGQKFTAVLAGQQMQGIGKGLKNVFKTQYEPKGFKNRFLNPFVP